MFRCTIRAVLWLTVVAEVACGWLIHIRDIRQQQLESELARAQRAQQGLQQARTKLAEVRAIINDTQQTQAEARKRLEEIQKMKQDREVKEPDESPDESARLEPNTPQ